jgi:hypothetical protein
MPSDTVKFKRSSYTKNIEVCIEDEVANKLHNFVDGGIINKIDNRLENMVWSYINFRISYIIEWNINNETG